MNTDTPDDRAHASCAPALTRRHLFAAVPAATTMLIAAPAMAAMAKSPEPSGNPDFAVKLEAFWEAHDLLRCGEQEVARLQDALPPPPEPPKELFETFSHPTEDGIAQPHRHLWSRGELRAIALKQELLRPEAPWLHSSPLDSPWRKRAAELLLIREQYDAQLKVHIEASDSLSQSITPLYDARQALGRDLLNIPARTISEIASKIHVIEAMELLDFESEEDVPETIFSEVLRVAGSLGDRGGR